MDAHKTDGGNELGQLQRNIRHTIYTQPARLASQQACTTAAAVSFLLPAYLPACLTNQL